MLEATGDSALTWKATAIGDGKTRIDATFFGLPTRSTQAALSAMAGLWQAVYADSMSMPESFSLRARDEYGVQAATSAEFKLR